MRQKCIGRREGAQKRGVGAKRGKQVEGDVWEEMSGWKEKEGGKVEGDWTPLGVTCSSCLLSGNLNIDQHAILTNVGWVGWKVTHYVYRSWIYPFMLRSPRGFPLGTFLGALVWCCYNGYMMGMWGEKKPFSSPNVGGCKQIGRKKSVKMRLGVGFQKEEKKTLEFVVFKKKLGFVSFQKKKLKFRVCFATFFHCLS